MWVFLLQPMRMTYTDMWQQFQRNINLVGTTDTNIQAEFNSSLGQKYQLMLAKLRNYRTTAEFDFETVINQQYYPYPPGEVTIDGIVITVGSVNFPLKIINSEYEWEQLNAILIQASALPQFYFPKRLSWGVWPIPQAEYEGQIIYHYRDINMTVADYTTGTLALTNDSDDVVGTTTVFTEAMIGRWLTVTDITVLGQGYWYQIADVTDSTHLTLNQAWTGVTTSGATFRIGQTPNFPEEGHMTLVDGVTADFYSHMRKDPDNAAKYHNLFWTGDEGNTNREEGNTKIGGGLIGLVNRYADRDDTRIINRSPRLNPLQYKVWATSLS